MDRVQIISSMFDRDGFGLEIGPSYNPFVPKSKRRKSTHRRLHRSTMDSSIDIETSLMWTYRELSR